ncbi:zinc-dependent peptidase [Pseudomonas segetis]|uniref:Zinc-dependent peptidase n=1 Tax=Pseudomonas segetis TaxID=298908 RepID=A0A239H4G6_9PSED|nr:M90 family metallopeptidase [Pseudomonas segetis]SNS76260.1 hypothetical protein SAMN05216255_3290 [Pseudomonas segetis]
MWILRKWRRRRILANNPVSAQSWAEVRRRLPITDGLNAPDEQCLQERAVLFLHEKHLTELDGAKLCDVDRLALATLAQLPILHLGELGWYRGFHEIILYPDDFISPQSARDASGVVHQWSGEHSGEAWLQGPVILACSGIRSSGAWNAYNLVIHEMAHKIDMLNGAANGLPPLHDNMRVQEWASTLQAAFDQLNLHLDTQPHAPPPIDAYAAENPAEFFAVCSEYFFSAPDLLNQAFPSVYAQFVLFYRQDPLQRLKLLEQAQPSYRQQHSNVPVLYRYV